MLFFVKKDIPITGFKGIAAAELYYFTAMLCTTTFSHTLYKIEKLGDSMSKVRGKRPEEEHIDFLLHSLSLKNVEIPPFLSNSHLMENYQFPILSACTFPLNWSYCLSRIS